MEKVEKVEEVIDTSSSSISTGSFSNFNGLSNVFIVRGDKTLTASDLSLTSGPRTYIVEDGNLTITSDIDAGDDNIAFVVR